MRAPAISRFVATSAAAVVLGIGLPLLSGTGTAWACGDEQNTSVEALPEQHATRPVIAFIAPTPGSMTAGGKVEIGLEVVNTTVRRTSASRRPSISTTSGVRPTSVT